MILPIILSILISSSASHAFVMIWARSIYSFESRGSATIPTKESNETVVLLRYELKVSLSSMISWGGVSKDDITFIATPAELPGV